MSDRKSIEQVKAYIVTHDDKLVLRGQKHDIGLDDKWWQKVPSTGEIVGYWNPETGEHMNADEIPTGEGWKAIHIRARELGDGVMLNAEGSFFDVRMMNLWADFGSRYRKGLDAVVKASKQGIITYRGTEKTERHRLEAIRNRVKRHWKVALYEHDLVILDEEIGQEMMTELRPYNTGLEYPHTVYIKGFEGTKRKEKPLLVKAYNMEPKHGVKGYKLEVSFRNEYIKRHDIRNPNEWLTQKDIQSKLRKSLVREWKGVFEMAPSTKGMLAEALDVQQPELFDFMANTEHTLTDLMERMETQERRTEDIEQRLSRIEKERKRDW